MRYTPVRRASISRAYSASSSWSSSGQDSTCSRMLLVIGVIDVILPYRDNIGTICCCRSPARCPMRKLFLIVAALCAFVAITRGAAAQAYPERPIMMLVPLATGGSTDVIARIVAEGMRASLGQPVIVENVAGAGGTIGVGRLARATPDGYTFGIGHWGTNMANGAIYSLQYDLIADFEPIALIATQPFLIVARKTHPAKDLKELVAWLKANADKATEGN